LVYFISVMVVALSLNTLVLEAKKSS